MSAERDAEMFLADVYARQPEGTVIAVGPKSKQHFVLNPSGALPWIVGKPDSYCRVTLLARRPEKGRGKAADSVALPGLVADFDVDGSPDGRGGVVTGAFETREAAIDCAQSIVQPTLLVCSGYGIQPWWLLHEMEMLASDEDRARVAAIARAWQDALRARAGVKKVDGVHDLARLMRAPGSLNGKGEKPVPVVLMDDGGPRYDLNELAALAPVAEVEAPPPVDSGEVDVEAILGRHADLARLVRREGKAPGDGSPSTWDYALGCRACEHGYDDHEVAALLRHNRRLHPDDKHKDERDAYIELTVAKVRAQVGAAPRDRTSEEAKTKLADLLRLERAPDARYVVQETAILGHGATARGVVYLSRGLTLEFERVGDISKPTRLSEELAASVGVAAKFEGLQAIQALALVRQIAERSMAMAELAATTAMASLILAYARVIEFNVALPRSRYEQWQEVQRHDPLADLKGHDPASYAAAMILLRDPESGATYVRAAWAQEVMRRELGPGYAAPRVQGLLLRAGWTQPTADGSIEATQKGRPRIRLWFYVVPKDWGES